MKKKIMAAATVVVTAAVVMFALGGCADNSAGENEALTNEGASNSVGVVTANDAVQSMAESMAKDIAESMAQSMFESMTRDMEENVTEETTVSTAAVTAEETTEAETETEDIQSIMRIYKINFGQYVRTSEDESKTVTIESDIYPYDCEEISIWVDTEWPYLNGIEPYDCIDLGNLKNYPNLKKLTLTGNGYNWKDVKLINCESAESLENLEEITLHAVFWDEDWLSGISSLKNLSIEYCRDYDGKFLENLKQVETLYLYRCAISDLSFVNGMSSLRELILEQSKLDNECIDSVEENYSVKKLTLIENSEYVSTYDDGEYEYSLTNITGVSKFRGLEYLDVSEPHLIDAENQKKELQEKLPACEIYF